MQRTVPSVHVRSGAGVQQAGGAGQAGDGTAVVGPDVMGVEADLLARIASLEDDLAESQHVNRERHDVIELLDRAANERLGLIEELDRVARERLDTINRLDEACRQREERIRALEARLAGAAVS